MENSKINNSDLSNDPCQIERDDLVICIKLFGQRDGVCREVYAQALDKCIRKNTRFDFSKLK